MKGSGAFAVPMTRRSRVLRAAERERIEKAGAGYQRWLLDKLSRKLNRAVVAGSRVHEARGAAGGKAGSAPLGRLK